MYYGKTVDMNNRQAMIDFLSNHFRYSTANGWNRSTSYAHNMKVYNMGLTEEQENVLWDLMDAEGAYSEINWLIDDFGDKYDHQWQAAFNGRSGGYLVLYQGGQKESEYKSYCISCGQPNFTLIEETGCRCGKCGKETRRNYNKPPMQVFTYPGRSLDMNEDFEDWDDDDLRRRVELVQEFDALADSIRDMAIAMSEQYRVEEVEEYVPRTKKVLVAVG